MSTQRLVQDALCTHFVSRFHSGRALQALASSQERLLLPMRRGAIGLFLVLGLAWGQLVAANSQASMDDPDVKAFAFAVYGKYKADVGVQDAKPETGGAIARCASDRLG